MIARAKSIATLDELRQFVNDVLCSYDLLLPGAFRLTERLLHRGGRPCGMYFCLHGPRSVKYSAVWESRHGSLFFYGPTGERFEKVQLSCEITLEPAA
jgi:hypothetical protein